jgi:flagellar motor switch protein FliG
LKGLYGENKMRRLIDRIHTVLERHQALDGRMEVLREAERVLEKKLSALSADQRPGEGYTDLAGIKCIVEMLNLVDHTSEKQIIEALEEEDPCLAEAVKKRMFVFEDIVMLDDTAVQKAIVMGKVDAIELAKALKGAAPAVQDKIFHIMSDRAADMLKEDMEYMGPVRLKDVEAARRKIVLIIRHFEDSGEIIVPRPGLE